MLLILRKVRALLLLQHLHSHKNFYLFGIIGLLLSFSAIANTVPGSFIYQGRAFDSSGVPITGTVDIKIQVYDHLGQCLLLSEKHNSLDLTTSDGVFSLQVGSSSGSSVRTAAGDDPGKDVFDVFSNGVALTGLTGTGCGGSYTGGSGNDRILRVTITKNSVDTTLADQNINAVPFSWNAQRVQGKEVLFSDGSSNSAQIISFQNFGSDAARDTAANTASGGSGAQTGQMAFNQGSLQIYTGATWENIPTGSGAGETNTGTSLGGTEAIYAGKSSATLQFKGLTAGSTKITLTGNANDIEIDVAEANLNLANLGGTLDVASGGTGSGTAGGARTNLGVAIGSDVQAYDADLSTIGGLSCADGKVLYRTGGAWTCGDAAIVSSQSANTVYAAPDGSAGTPSFRALVANDIPALDTSKITSGTMATARLGSGTANSGSFLRGDQTWHAIATSNTLGGGSASDTEIPSQKAVKDYVDGLAGSTYDGAYVNVTGDTMTGPLVVDGSSDAIQLTVQAHSTQTANLLELQSSAGSDLLLMDGKGNLGLGENSPEAILHVNGLRTATGTISGATTSITGVGTSFTTEIRPGDLIRVGGQDRRVASITNDTLLTIDSAFPSDPGGAAFEIKKKSILENGYISIGPSSHIPETQLHVFGTTTSYHMNVGNGAASNPVIILEGLATAEFQVRALESTNTLFLGSGAFTNGINISNTGNIGIGDDSPDAALDVHGSKVFLAAPSSDPSTTGMAANQITFYINEAGDELHARAMESDGSTSWTANLTPTGTSTSGATTGAYNINANSDGSGSDGNIVFQNNGTQMAIINDSGNMAIGSSAPTAQLDVDANSDQVLLNLKMDASQSANPLVLENSSDAVVFAINPNGYLYWGSNLVMHESGSNSFFAGRLAGNNNSGSGNTAVGREALDASPSGGGNTALGYRALSSNTSGVSNTAVGTNAMRDNTTATHNTAVGEAALQSNTTGNGNVAIGRSALLSNVGSHHNIAIGAGALMTHSTASSTTSNIAIGSNALNSNTTGSYNLAIGYQTLETSTDQSNNIALGFRALRYVTAHPNLAIGNNSMDEATTAAYNISLGQDTLTKLTTGQGNVAIGAYALDAVVTGSNNVGVGRNALSAATSGGSTAIGTNAMQATTTGGGTAVGSQALASNTTGAYNTAIGSSAMNTNLDGSYNSALGNNALDANTSGLRNSAFGMDALGANTTGGENSAFGLESLYTNIIGNQNTAMGRQALYLSTVDNQTAFGYQALRNSSTGTGNAAFGHQAGDTNTTGSSNTYLGNSADASANNLDSSIALGFGATVTASNQMAIGSDGNGIANLFIGEGVESNTPLNSTIQATGATNGGVSNTSGANLTIAGGVSTGSADGGEILFQTSLAGGAGSTANTLSTHMRIDGKGSVIFGGGTVNTAYNTEMPVSTATYDGYAYHDNDGLGTVFMGEAYGALGLFGDAGRGTEHVVVSASNANMTNSGYIQVFSRNTDVATADRGDVRLIAGHNAGQSMDGEITFDTSSTRRMTIQDDGSVSIGSGTANTTLTVAGVITPSADNTYSLGNGTYRFTDVYAASGSVNTSDRRQKRDIEGTDLGLDFILGLNPVMYRWKDHPNKGVFYGFIAQELEDYLNGKDFAGLVYDKDADIYGVRYTEFISPLVKATQELNNKCEMTNEQIAELDQRLQSLERDIASLKEENNKLKSENEMFKEVLCELKPSASFCQ